MAAKKKSGRLYIRTDPDVHTRLAKCAKALGVDLNGLVNWILRMELPEYEARARYAGDPRLLRLRRSLDELFCELAAPDPHEHEDPENEELEIDEETAKSIVKDEKIQDWLGDAYHTFMSASDEGGREALHGILEAFIQLARFVGPEHLGFRVITEPVVPISEQERENAQRMYQEARIKEARRILQEHMQTSPQSLDETAKGENHDDDAQR